MALIQIYYARWCSVCAHSLSLAAEIAERHPEINVELIDVATLSEENRPDPVFATPTWLWDGRLYSLGNPDPAELWQQLAELSPTPFISQPEDKSYGREDAPPFDDGVVSGSI